MLHHMNRAAAKVPSGAYVNRYSSTTNLTTYTFSTSDIGAADNSRLIVVVVLASSTTSANRSVSSVTIGGVTATRHFTTTASPLCVSICSLPVSTGTTADIVVTMNNTCNNCTIAVYRLINVSSAFPQAFDSVTSASSTTATRNIAASQNAIVIAGTTGSAATSTTATWTGVTEDFDTLIESGMRTAGIDTVATGSSTYTVTCTASASTTMTMGCISWR